METQPRSQPWTGHERSSTMFVAAAMGLVAAFVVAVVFWLSDSRSAQPISEADVFADDVTVRLWVDTCNGDPIAEVTETIDEVRLTVEADTTSIQRALCQAIVVIALDSPLDGRCIIDGSDGHTVTKRLQD